MRYLYEGARLLLPGLGVGFLLGSIAQDFAQPFWALGLICCVAGVIINLFPVNSNENDQARRRMLTVLGAIVPWVALGVLIATLAMRLFS